MTRKVFREDPCLAELETGGAHLKKTGEVGKITLKRRNIGKGKERIETFVGDNREPIVE